MTAGRLLVYFSLTPDKLKGGDMGGGYYLEGMEKLTEKSRNLHRAVYSLIEELEAVDYYQQRADVTADPELRMILEHNRDEEKEHAAMLLEWIRRNDAGFEKEFRSYLFKEGRSVVELEKGE